MGDRLDSVFASEQLGLPLFGRSLGHDPLGADEGVLTTVVGIAARAFEDQRA